jgi:alcohol dehydrogenase
MQAYTYISKGKFELVEKPKPVLMHERDKGNTGQHLFQ